MYEFPQDEGDVDRSDAPYLPPMKITAEDDVSYTVEAMFTYGNVPARIPKYLLPSNDEGTLCALEQFSARIMK